ncbi:restriction endonuclease subunit S, partial [Vibrio vulnificus]|nr:restriction endonuclease subunit S [Vibrio vulnificus]
MLAFSTMSTRASLNNEMIGRLEISYPPKEAQRHIAHVLKTLDNKITLNRQINQTLEQMAQTLFKSWFVDFDPVMDNALDAGSPIPDEL